MPYFIKETRKKKDLYYQIYESHYDRDKGYSVHSSHRVLGYLSDLRRQGISDPREHFREEVSALNLAEKEKRRSERFATIRDRTLRRRAGYFPAKAVLGKLGVRGDLELLASASGFRFDLYDMLCALVFCRLLEPCSKKASLERVMPQLFAPYGFSYGQVLEACGFLGGHYAKVVDMFARATRKTYGIDADRVYFDCTNFYFEIDREDCLRRKGKSKEGRHDPIVGLGLLLDAHMVPVHMSLYPGNESEKPCIRKAVEELKALTGTQGRTIQVADKGLNCARNIHAALGHEDGYIFSKSVKVLEEKEKTWVFSGPASDWKRSPGGGFLYKECVDSFRYSFYDDAGAKVEFSVREKRVVTLNPSLRAKQRAEIDRLVEKARSNTLSRAKRGEFGESARFVRFVSRDGKEASAIPVLDQDAVDEAYRYCGLNMLVSSETGLPAVDIHKVYRNLWRIEETFRAMKTGLEARPVFLQKEDAIKGHFLICYLSILVLRLIQFKELGDRFGTDEILDFMRNFIVVEDPARKEYTNIGRYGRLYDTYSEKYGVMLHLFKLKRRDLETLGL